MVSIYDLSICRFHATIGIGILYTVYGQVTEYTEYTHRPQPPLFI